MKSANNIIVVHDTEHEASKSYMAGAQAFRDNTPWNLNPHRDGTRAHEDWASGHENDSGGEHFRWGVDVMAVPRDGARFEMDPAMPRLENGDVDDDWVRAQRKRLCSVST